MIIAKRIAALIGAAALALLCGGTAAAQNGTISKLQVCLDIGNKTSTQSLTCIGEDGHDLGKAGKTFRSGDQIFVLVSFTNLPVGTHQVSVNYRKRGSGGTYQSFSGSSKTITVKNRAQNWSIWFPAHFKAVNQYEIIVGTQFPNAMVRRHKKYCVGCPGE